VGNAVVAVYECAATGAALEVTLHTGDHTWPRADQGFDTNARIWEFLRRYTTE
jgi:poly(3-hydroxybutyrate) depolymerase